MPTVSGRVIFDKYKSKTISNGDTGILGITIILQNKLSGLRVAGITDIKKQAFLDELAIYTTSEVNPKIAISLLNPINPGESVSITFQVKVADTLPNPNTILNIANVDYTYTIDPGHPNAASKTEISQSVATKINTADLYKSGNFIKLVDKKNVSRRDTLTYILIIENIGNVSANNIIIVDQISKGTIFIERSIISTVLFTGDNPSTGINLTAPINPGETVTITYRVKVIHELQNPNPIKYAGTVSYTYTVDPANPNGDADIGNASIAYIPPMISCGCHCCIEPIGPTGITLIWGEDH